MARKERARGLGHRAGEGLGVPQGVTTAAAYRDGKRFIHVSTGIMLLPAGFEEVARLLQRAGFVARVVRDIQSARLRNACGRGTENDAARKRSAG
jgi:hypothetical protein